MRPSGSACGLERYCWQFNASKTGWNLWLSPFLWQEKKSMLKKINFFHSVYSIATKGRREKVLRINLLTKSPLWGHSWCIFLFLSCLCMYMFKHIYVYIYIFRTYIYIYIICSNAKSCTNLNIIWSIWALSRDFSSSLRPHKSTLVAEGLIN